LARARGVLPLFSQSFSFYINGLSVKPYIYEREEYLKKRRVGRRIIGMPGTRNLQAPGTVDTATTGGGCKTWAK